MAKLQVWKKTEPKTGFSGCCDCGGVVVVVVVAAAADVDAVAVLRIGVPLLFMC